MSNKNVFSHPHFALHETGTHGFSYANGEYHHLFYTKRIESRVTFSTTFGQERRVIHFEFYDSPGLYHYQKSHDDAYFTDELVKFVGKVSVRHEIQLVHDTDIFSAPQENLVGIWFHGRLRPASGGCVRGNVSWCEIRQKIMIVLSWGDPMIKQIFFQGEINVRS